MKMTFINFHVVCFISFHVLLSGKIISETSLIQMFHFLFNYKNALCIFAANRLFYYFFTLFGYIIIIKKVLLLRNRNITVIKIFLQYCKHSTSADTCRHYCNFVLFLSSSCTAKSTPFV